MIIEAEKYHDLPSSNWRPRKAGVIIHSESEGLRNQWGGSNTSQPKGQKREEVYQLSLEVEKGSKFLLPGLLLYLRT